MPAGQLAQSVHDEQCHPGHQQLQSWDQHLSPHASAGVAVHARTTAAHTRNDGRGKENVDVTATMTVEVTREILNLGATETSTAWQDIPTTASTRRLALGGAIRFGLTRASFSTPRATPCLGSSSLRRRHVIVMAATDAIITTATIVHGSDDDVCGAISAVVVS